MHLLTLFFFVIYFFYLYIYRHVRLAKLERPDRFHHLDLEFLHQRLHLLSP